MSQPMSIIIPIIKLISQSLISKKPLFLGLDFKVPENQNNSDSYLPLLANKNHSPISFEGNHEGFSLAPLSHLHTSCSASQSSCIFIPVFINKINPAKSRAYPVFLVRWSVSIFVFVTQHFKHLSHI